MSNFDDLWDNTETAKPKDVVTDSKKSFDDLWDTVPEEPAKPAPTATVSPVPSPAPVVPKPTEIAPIHQPLGATVNPNDRAVSAPASSTAQAIPPQYGNAPQKTPEQVFGAYPTNAAQGLSLQTSPMVTPVNVQPVTAPVSTTTAPTAIPVPKPQPNIQQGVAPASTTSVNIPPAPPEKTEQLTEGSFKPSSTDVQRPGMKAEGTGLAPIMAKVGGKVYADAAELLVAPAKAVAEAWTSGTSGADRAAAVDKAYDNFFQPVRDAYKLTPEQEQTIKDMGLRGKALVMATEFVAQLPMFMGGIGGAEKLVAGLATKYGPEVMNEGASALKTLTGMGGMGAISGAQEAAAETASGQPIKAGSVLKSGATGALWGIPVLGALKGLKKAEGASRAAEEAMKPPEIAPAAPKPSEPAPAPAPNKPVEIPKFDVPRAPEAIVNRKALLDADISAHPDPAARERLKARSYDKLLGDYGVTSNEDFGVALKQLESSKTPYTFEFFDIGNLNGANSEKGHLAVDAAMKRLYGEIYTKEATERGAIVARGTKSDEFQAAWPNYTKDQVQQIRDAIETKIRSERDALGFGNTKSPKLNNIETGALHTDFGLTEGKPGKYGDMYREAEHYANKKKYDYYLAKLPKKAYNIAGEQNVNTSVPTTEQSSAQHATGPSDALAVRERGNAGGKDIGAGVSEEVRPEEAIAKTPSLQGRNDEASKELLARSEGEKALSSISHEPDITEQPASEEYLGKIISDDEASSALFAHDSKTPITDVPTHSRQFVVDQRVQDLQDAEVAEHEQKIEDLQNEIERDQKIYNAASSVPKISSESLAQAGDKSFAKEMGKFASKQGVGADRARMDALADNPQAFSDLGKAESYNVSNAPKDFETPDQLVQFLREAPTKKSILEKMKKLRSLKAGEDEPDIAKRVKEYRDNLEAQANPKPPVTQTELLGGKENPPVALATEKPTIQYKGTEDLPIFEKEQQASEPVSLFEKPKKGEEPPPAAVSAEPPKPPTEPPPVAEGAAEEEPKPKKDLLHGLKGEEGAVGFGPKEDIVKAVKEHLDKTKEQIKYSGDLVNDYYKLLGANEADKIRLREVIDKNNIFLKDQEAIYHWIENKNEPITPEQEKIFHDVIEPVMDESSEVFSRLRNEGVPVPKEGHLSRNAQDRGGWLDRLASGAKDVVSGGPLRKTTGSMKHRVMMAATDELGNRRVVSIKNGKVTAWDNKKSTEMGNVNFKTKEELLDKEIAPLEKRQKSLENELSILEKRKGAEGLKERATNRINEIDKKMDGLVPFDEEYKALDKEKKFLENRMKVLNQVGTSEIRRENINNELDDIAQKIDDIESSYDPNEMNDKVFTDKGGTEWKIGQATTKEIEQHTNVKYHKTLLLNELVNLQKLKMADRATQYLENLKTDPEFNKISIKIGTKNIPDDYKPTNLPQLKGYAFPKRVSETLDAFYKNADKGLMSPDNLYSKANSVLRNAIFFNPFMHIPNILVHAIVGRGLTSFLIPGRYIDLVKTSRRAIEDVITMNDNYKDALGKGAGAFYAKQANKDLYKVMLDKATKELEDKPLVANAISKALGYSNPAKLIKAIYDFSGRATWFIQDFAERQAMYEEMLHGKSMEEAIVDVGKHIPNYRIPARVLNSTAISKLMKTENGVTMFGAYHYGALRSYGEMAKSLLGNVPLKERAEAADKLAMMAVIGFFVYPQLDKLAKMATGNENAKFRRAGAITFPYKTKQLATGKIDFSDWLQTIMTPSVGLQTGVNILSGRDFRTGAKLPIEKAVLRSVSPLGYGEKIGRGQLTPKNFALSLIGVSSPKVDIDKMSSTEMEAYKMAMSHIPQNERSKSQIQTSNEKQKLAQEYKKTKDIKPLNQAIKDKKITKADRTNIIKGTTQSTLEHYAERLSYDEVTKLMENATLDEKKQLYSGSYMIKDKIKQLSGLKRGDKKFDTTKEEVRKMLVENGHKVQKMPQGEEKTIAANHNKALNTLFKKGLRGVFEDIKDEENKESTKEAPSSSKPFSIRDTTDED